MARLAGSEKIEQIVAADIERYDTHVIVTVADDGQGARKLSMRDETAACLTPHSEINKRIHVAM